MNQKVYKDLCRTLYISQYNYCTALPMSQMDKTSLMKTVQRGQPQNWQNNEDSVHFQAANAGHVTSMNDTDCNTHWFLYARETEKRSSGKYH